MKFDPDLINEVKRQAPPGVEFELHEVEAALVRAVNGNPGVFVFTTAVQRAANKAIAVRRETASAEGAV